MCLCFCCKRVRIMWRNNNKFKGRTRTGLSLAVCQSTGTTKLICGDFWPLDMSGHPPTIITCNSRAPTPVPVLHVSHALPPRSWGPHKFIFPSLQATGHSYVQNTKKRVLIASNLFVYPSGLKNFIVKAHHLARFLC